MTDQPSGNPDEAEAEAADAAERIMTTNNLPGDGVGCTGGSLPPARVEIPLPRPLGTDQPSSNPGEFDPHRPRTSVTIQTVGLGVHAELRVERVTVEIGKIDPTADDIAQACEQAMLGAGYLPETVQEIFHG